MEEIKSALHEVYGTQNKVILLTTFLESIVVFLISYTVLLLINFFKNISVIIAIGYFLYKSFKRINNKSLRDVEQRNPFLAEKLRTAADTLLFDNFMVQKLRESVLSDLSQVRISTFIDVRKLFKITAIMCLLAIVNIFLGVAHAQIIDLEAIIGGMDFDFNLKDKLLKGYVSQSLLDVNADLNDINKDSQIGEIDDLMQLRNSNLMKKNEKLPDDLFKASDKSFEETTSKKKRIYIRNYFTSIRKAEAGN
ncbi:hypothetical protein HZA96_01460 [Candidatus Woesearchaeota archaeon]|nr:hypothetical protein [Candidatus Woesearchaeota archaeon]